MKKQTKKDVLPYDLWPTSDKPLRFINAEQIMPETLAKKLGWSSDEVKPITDPKKIKTRQDGLKILIGTSFKDVLQKKISENVSWGRKFFQDFGKDSEFRLKSDDFLLELEKALDAVKISKESIYRTLISDFKKEREVVVGLEDSLTNQLKAELEKVYSYNGIVTLESKLLEFDKNGRSFESTKIKTKSDSYGMSEYSFHLKEPLIVKVSRNITSLYLKTNEKGLYLFILWVLRIICFIPFLIPSLIINSFADKNANDVMYTRELPESIEIELRRLHNKFKEKLNERLDNVQLIKNNISYIKDSLIVKTEFQFNLSPRLGFTVRLIDFSYKINLKDEYVARFNGEWNSSFSMTGGLPENSNVSFYSLFVGILFRARSRRLANKAATKFVKLPLMTALEKVFTECNNLLVDGKGYVSENGYLEMMDELKYSRIRDAIEGLHLTENWNKVLNYRKKFISVYKQMNSINSTAYRISKTIEEYKDFPFCFPEIVDDSKNIVSFGSIAPLHLIGRKNKQQNAELGKDDLKLITGLPALNGQIISITGQNGGGKTVIETELIYSLYLAHCGLPVFADNFVMNAKDVIAMVFVERGEGSMLQLIMQKLKNIAEEIENNKNNKVVVIIDELLTGTQEDVGLQIGQQYLSMLARKKCSVMFVTQITQLAEFANQNLNALCFHFDSKGELQQGIGKGNAMVLAEEVGLDKFLNPA